MIKKLLSIGIHSELSVVEQNKLKVFCASIWLIMLINFMYGIWGLFFHVYMATYLMVYSALACTTSLIFLSKRKYNFTFHFTLFYGLTFLSGFILFFGIDMNTHFFFLFLPVAVSIIFNKKTYSLVYFLIGLIVLLCFIYFTKIGLKPLYPNAFDNISIYFACSNAIFSSTLIFLGVRMFKNENLKYAAQVEEQNLLLEEKNKETADSINYASRIQNAMLPEINELNTFFDDSFILLLPKDIVSGDFYWIAKSRDQLIYATADCTGHGVPGGFMTMLGMSFLDELVNEKNITDPSEILNVLRDKVISALRQSAAFGQSKDGMDISICLIDKKQMRLTFAGANNGMYVFQNDKLTHLNGDKQPCGFSDYRLPFTSQTIELVKPCTLFTYTDGFADQFGGKDGKKFKYKQLEQILVAGINLPMHEQLEKLKNGFYQWKGKLEQVDDVCLIGVTLK